jgi:hypothetical protein
VITAIVTYSLPPAIGLVECKAHYERIAAGFGDAPGLIRKQFIWSESGVAGGVYLWRTLSDAKKFYQGPWLAGILERYGTYPHIEYFETLAITENPGGRVILPDSQGGQSSRARNGTAGPLARGTA